MTGAYVRVQRDGRWQSVEVEHLTDAERGAEFGDRSHAELIRLLNVVCNTLHAFELKVARLQERD